MPRPPQAPTMRTPLRRALWKIVSPPRVSISRSICGKRSRCTGSAWAIGRPDIGISGGRRFAGDAAVSDGSGHSSQRDQRTGGRSMPTPSTRETDFSGAHRAPSGQASRRWSRPRRGAAPCPAASRARPGSPARSSPAMLRPWRLASRQHAVLRSRPSANSSSLPSRRARAPANGGARRTARAPAAPARGPSVHDRARDRGQFARSGSRRGACERLAAQRSDRAGGTVSGTMR